MFASSLRMSFFSFVHRTFSGMGKMACLEKNVGTGAQLPPSKCVKEALILRITQVLQHI